MSICFVAHQLCGSAPRGECLDRGQGYNRERPHQTLGSMITNEYRARERMLMPDLPNNI